MYEGQKQVHGWHHAPSPRELGKSQTKWHWTRSGVDSCS